MTSKLDEPGVSEFIPSPRPSRDFVPDDTSSMGYALLSAQYLEIVRVLNRVDALRIKLIQQIELRDMGGYIRMAAQREPLGVFWTKFSELTKPQQVEALKLNEFNGKSWHLLLPYFPAVSE